MTFFADLSPYAYSSAAPGSPGVLNVGWLDAAHDFPREDASHRTLDEIWDRCGIAVNPTRGIHLCEFCADPPATYLRGGIRRLLGFAEIRAFHPRGVVFAAPNLMFHYVERHGYRPPAAFIEALEHGPRAGSAAYRAALERLCVPWRENPPVLTEPRSFRFGEIQAVVRERDPKP